MARPAGKGAGRIEWDAVKADAHGIYFAYPTIALHGPPTRGGGAGMPFGRAPRAMLGAKCCGECARERAFS